MVHTKIVIKVNDSMYLANYGANLANEWSIVGNPHEAHDFSNDEEFAPKLAKRVGGKAYKLTETITYDLQEL